MYENIRSFIYRTINVIRLFPRQIKWFFQRGFKGWCDEDIWSIDITLNERLPRMIRELKDVQIGCYPSFFDKDIYIDPESAWHVVLERIAEGFEANNALCNLNFKNEKEKFELERKCKLEFRLFIKYYNCLWY